MLQTPLSAEPAEVAQWMENHFITSFRHEADPKYWPRAKDRGVFALTLICLAFCSAAAGLVNVTNNPSSTQAIEFIKTWLGGVPGRMGNRYRVSAAALYSLFRHGLVHQRIPGRLDLEDGRTLGWILSRDGKRAEHLRVSKSRMYTTRPVRHDGHYRISVEPDVLFRDCLRAFEALRDKCRTDAVLAAQMYKGILLADEPRKLLGSGKTKQAILEEIRKGLRRSRYHPLI